MLLLSEQTFPARTESLALVRQLVRQTCQQAACGDEFSEAMVLAVNEACMNVIQHAYQFADGKEFSLRLLQDEGIFHAQVLDNGRPASLGDLRPRPLDELRPGGLGVRFMREVTDQLAYLDPPAGFSNLLQLSKRIAEGE